MIYDQKVDLKELEPILEQVTKIEELSQKFRGQIMKFTSLERKIRLLQEELRSLQNTLKSSKRKINLSFEKILEEHGEFLSEAFDPSSREWEFQYWLRKNRDLFQEMDTILESKMAEILQDGVLPK